MSEAAPAQVAAALAASKGRAAAAAQWDTPGLDEAHDESCSEDESEVMGCMDSFKDFPDALDAASLDADILGTPAATECLAKRSVVSLASCSGESADDLDPGELSVAASEPTPQGPKSSKRSSNPILAARKRILNKQRKEARAAKRQLRREMKAASRRRGTGANVDQFLERTKERLDSKITEADAVILQAAMEKAAGRITRGQAIDAGGFVAKTRERILGRRVASENVSAARESASAARAENHIVDLEEFHKKTQDRVLDRIWSKLPQVGSARAGVSHQSGDDGGGARRQFSRRRIAVVGAGPVGLWAAVLLALKYGRIGPQCRVRRPDAPEVVIYEGREEQKHCARTDIRIALSTATQSLLNTRTNSRRFCSGMPVADIEAALLRKWRKLKALGRIEFASSSSDPADLAADGFDCVLWAGGRRSLEASTRKELGCEQRTGHSERVIVFQVEDLEAGTAVQLASCDLSGVAFAASKLSTLRVMLRPGGDRSGWLWLFGLPSDAIPSSDSGGSAPAEAASGSAPTINGKPSPVETRTLQESFDGAMEPEASSFLPLRLAAQALQQKLQPRSCQSRWVDAAFWSSDLSVCEGVAGCPVVLLGDACCGRPFYTGTTLNRHMWDVAQLIDGTDCWADDGYPLGTSHFAFFERNYQQELLRLPEFQRKGRSVNKGTAAATSSPTPSAAAARSSTTFATVDVSGGSASPSSPRAAASGTAAAMSSTTFSAMDAAAGSAGSAAPPLSPHATSSATRKLRPSSSPASVVLAPLGTAPCLGTEMSPSLSASAPRLTTAMSAPAPPAAAHPAFHSPKAPPCLAQLRA